MGNKVNKHSAPKLRQRARRAAQVRKRMHGTADRPRLTVYRSNVHIYAQVVDDDRGHTLVQTSSRVAAIAAASGELDKKGTAKLVGTAVAEAAKAAGVAKVVFDRNGFKYHGRIAALADAARKAGLEF